MIIDPNELGLQDIYFEELNHINNHIFDMKDELAKEKRENCRNVMEYIKKRLSRWSLINSYVLYEEIRNALANYNESMEEKKQKKSGNFMHWKSVFWNR